MEKSVNKYDNGKDNKKKIAIAVMSGVVAVSAVTACAGGEKGGSPLGNLGGGSSNEVPYGKYCADHPENWQLDEVNVDRGMPIAADGDLDQMTETDENNYPSDALVSQALERADELNGTLYTPEESGAEDFRNSYKELLDNYTGSSVDSFTGAEIKPRVYIHMYGNGGKPSDDGKSHEFKVCAAFYGKANEEELTYDN